MVESGRAGSYAARIRARKRRLRPRLTGEGRGENQGRGGFSSLECCDKQDRLIREVTRRVAENTFLSAEDTEGRGDTKGVSDFLCAVERPFADQWKQITF